MSNTTTTATTNNTAAAEAPTPLFAMPHIAGESITGASVIGRGMTNVQALALAGGKASPETRGLGLAAALAMLAFGSISRKANPFSPPKGKGSHDVQACVVAWDRVEMPQAGRGMPLAVEHIKTAFAVFVAAHAETLARLKAEKAGKGAGKGEAKAGTPDVTKPEGEDSAPAANNAPAAIGRALATDVLAADRLRTSRKLRALRATIRAQRAEIEALKAALAEQAVPKRAVRKAA